MGLEESDAVAAFMRSFTMGIKEYDSLDPSVKLALSFCDFVSLKGKI